MDLNAQNQCEFCFQFSNSDSASSMGLCIGLYMLAAAVVLVTVCGNLLVIISICCFRHLHTPTNLIVLSLAIIDILIGLTVMPFHFSLIIESTWHFGTVICNLFNIFSYILPCASMYNVAFISVDRYFALCDPFLYASKMKMRVSLFVISLIWIFSTFYSLAIIYFNGNIGDVKHNAACTADCVISESSGVIDFVCVFVVPCTIIISLYSKVFVIAKKHIIAISKHSTTNCKRAVVSERKAALNLGILVVVFLLCFIPFYLSIFVSLTNLNWSLYGAITGATTLVYLNSALNPLIYALFYPWFQKCVKHILMLDKVGSALSNCVFKKHKNTA